MDKETKNLNKLTETTTNKRGEHMLEKRKPRGKSGLVMISIVRFL